MIEIHLNIFHKYKVELVFEIYFVMSEISFTKWVISINWNMFFEFNETNFMNWKKTLFEWVKSFLKWVKYSFWNECNLFYEASDFFLFNWVKSFFWNNWNELFETSDIKWVKLVLWNNLSLFLWHIPASWNKNIFIFKWVN